MKYSNPVRIRSVDKNQPVKYAKFDDFGNQFCNFWKTSACVIWLVHDSDLVWVTHNTCSIYDLFSCQNFEKCIYKRISGQPRTICSTTTQFKVYHYFHISWKFKFESQYEIYLYFTVEDQTITVSSIWLKNCWRPFHRR